MYFCCVNIFVSARETHISGRETCVSGREMYISRRRITKLTKKINFCKADRKQKQDREKRKVGKRNIKNRIHQKEQKRKLNELTEKLGSKFEAKIQMKKEKNKKM